MSLPVDAQDDRVAEILNLDTEDTRPDFLPPEPEDHQWVKALEHDLAGRILTENTNGVSEMCQDPSIMDMDSESAFIAGYRTAILVLRTIANDEHRVVKLIELPAE